MKRNSFWSVIALLAVMVMLVLPGCDMGNDPEPGLEDNSVNGVMTLSTAQKIFAITESAESVTIDKFLDVDALGDYINGIVRRARAGEVEAVFRINSINGKPVTRIAAGAFKPDPTLGGRDDISRLAAVLNPNTEAANLPVPEIVLPETLDLDIDALGGGLFEGVSGAIKVDIPTPVLERVMEKEIEKRVEAAAERDGLTEAEKEELKEELKQALVEEPNGAVAQELTGKLVETLKEAVGKGTGEGAGITIEQVIPDSANPDAPVIVPELPPIDVAPEPAAPVTPPVNTPPVTPPYTPPPVLDTTAPVLSGGRFGALDTFGGDTADIAFNTDEAGTYYYVALDSSGLTPVPTEAEIRAASSGSSGSPGSPGSPGSSTVSGSAKVQAGTAIVTISGLTVNTPYIVYLIVVDARGNTSEILTIGPFTPTYTQAGQLAADLGGKNKEGDNVNTVILMDDNTITSGTVMIPDGITLDTGTYILTLNNSATLSVAGTLSIKGTFNMAGTLSVDTTGVINVEQNGTIIYTQDRTGGGEFKGIINVKSGGTSMDLENSSAALWSNATGRTVHYAGSKTYSGGNTPNHLLIGTAEDPTTTRIALTSGTFSSGYTLDGKATLNRTFGLDGRTLTIKTGGKITIHTRIEENSGVYGGLWVVGPTSAILGEEGASIEIETPEGGVQGGKIYFSSGGVSNFYDSSENQIKIPSGSNFEIGVGVYDWNDDLQGWKQQ